MGVSFDAPEVNTAFREKHGMQFELWSDDDAHTLATYYGAGTVDTPVALRITKLLDEHGDLILEYVNGIDVGVHPADVLGDCQTIWAP